MNTDELKERLDKILENENCFKIKDLAINGNDIMRITGLKPSKQIGDILNILFDEVINEKIDNSKEELSNIVIKLTE